MAAASPGLFRDIAPESGLRFVHDPGMAGRTLLTEIVGPGGALFDFDGDGDLDAYLVNGGSREDSAPAPNRLFRREADGSYTDVTAESGAGDTGYGMGVALADVDNDGDPDLYLTNHGPDVLLRNNGDGTFSDVTAVAGISGSLWSSSAAFLDFDDDGFLDLYVAHYLDYSPPRACTDAAGRTDYCGPAVFPGEADTLYRNNGDGSFTDVSRESGIARAHGKGLGVFPADFDGDGDQDIFVANDGEENQLWINQGHGRFEDHALVMGTAFNFDGKAEASMGIAVGDPDGDGDLDIFVTHLNRETNTFYSSGGGGWFEDATASSGLGAPSLIYTGFGTEFVDVDLDGDADLLVVNGRVRRGPDAAPASDLPDPFYADYAEPNQVMENDGRGRFSDISGRGGEFSAHVEVSRGLIPGDLDGDGDLDLLVTNCNGPARLYLREGRPGGSWLAVRAADPGLNRDAVGAVVKVTAGGATQTRLVTAVSSYLSAREPIAHFGLGAAEAYDRIEVAWPGGTVESFPGGPARRTVRLIRGGGGIAPATGGTRP